MIPAGSVFFHEIRPDVPIPPSRRVQGTGFFGCASEKARGGLARMRGRSKNPLCPLKMAALSVQGGLPGCFRRQVRQASFTQGGSVSSVVMPAGVVSIPRRRAAGARDGSEGRNRGAGCGGGRRTLRHGTGRAWSEGGMTRQKAAARREARRTEEARSEEKGKAAPCSARGGSAGARQISGDRGGGGIVPSLRQGAGRCPASFPVRCFRRSFRRTGR